MKIGIIAEGHSDRAVIKNILQGITGIDGNDIIAILPIDALDETDLANIPREQFGGWAAVRNECMQREFIDLFFERFGDNFMVIQIDTAESAQYGITQPKKDGTYTTEIRKLIIRKIIEWIGNDISENLLFAIAVEEIDAWILTILENRDSSLSADPKKRLERIKGFRPGRMKPNFELYCSYSDKLKFASDQEMASFRSRNQSLDLFCEEIAIKVLPLINN